MQCPFRYAQSRFCASLKHTNWLDVVKRPSLSRVEERMDSVGLARATLVHARLRGPRGVRSSLTAPVSSLPLCVSIHMFLFRIDLEV